MCRHKGGPLVSGMDAELGNLKAPEIARRDLHVSKSTDLSDSFSFFFSDSNNFRIENSYISSPDTSTNMSRKFRFFWMANLQLAAQLDLQLGQIRAAGVVHVVDHRGEKHRKDLRYQLHSRLCSQLHSRFCSQLHSRFCSQPHSQDVL